jgi:outer membrane protein assembly factor BamB
MRGGWPCARIAIACGLVLCLCGADWRQFRGNEGEGATSAKGPAKLDKVAWKSPLPGRGISGPIAVGDRIYVTASSGYQQDRLHVLAIKASDGSRLWERQFWATGRTQCHPSMSVASSTPASDGQCVVALFSTNDLACLDANGNLRWFRGLTYDYPNVSNSLGMASSPVIVGDMVIAQTETDDDSIAVGLDIQTGEQRWKLDRPRSSNWTSPLILRGNNRESDLVVLQSSKGLVALHPRTGKTVWSYNEGASTIPSSTAGDQLLFVPSHGLTALSSDAGGGKPTIKWQKPQVSPATASPVFCDGRVYTLTGAGVLVASSAKTGDVMWRLRLPGSFTASPIAAPGRLYFFNEEGTGRVVTTGEKSGKITSDFPLKERILCTPALSDGALYIRSDQHLWKLAD